MDQAYSDAFYAGQQSGSIASANIVVPEILRLFSISSVVDFGCGVGGWLAVFQKHGVRDVLGIDGDYVPKARLRVGEDQFVAMDLTAVTPLDRKFDLACSLEVAEHLPERTADPLVSALVAAAPVVLFSAAIPFQGGVQHINEQWQSYWASKFSKHGYVAVDCIRPVIHANPAVQWWYRQNILVYCRSDRIPAGSEPVSSAYQLDRVDPAMRGRAAVPPESGRDALSRIGESLLVLSRAIPRAVARAASRSGSSW